MPYRIEAVLTAVANNTKGASRIRPSETVDKTIPSRLIGATLEDVVLPQGDHEARVAIIGDDSRFALRYVIGIVSHCRVPR